MMNHNKNTIVYSLNVEDIQTVALQELDRELTKDELKIVEDEIGNHIKWYDIISDIFILEKIK
jgi:hypothetical protein